MVWQINDPSSHLALASNASIPLPLHARHFPRANPTVWAALVIIENPRRPRSKDIKLPPIRGAGSGPGGNSMNQQYCNGARTGSTKASAGEDNGRTCQYPSGRSHIHSMTSCDCDAVVTFLPTIYTYISCRGVPTYIFVARGVYAKVFCVCTHHKGHFR